jgi:tetratricopeptide (TPR) repeat protein
VPELVDHLPKVAELEKNDRESQIHHQLELKNKLISQLNHNRLYQLNEQEEIVIKQLVKNFPNDTEIKLLHQAHLEKKADEILSRVRSQRRSAPINSTPYAVHNEESEEFISKLKVQIQKIATDYKDTFPEQIYNLALLCMNFELYDFSFDLLSQAPETYAGEWLKAEILFESGRFLDLLKQVEDLEKKFSTTPDSTYGAIYLKSQAYYGLGQKDIAIQMLEALSEAYPSYRSTEALLHQWRST